MNFTYNKESLKEIIASWKDFKPSSSSDRIDLKNHGLIVGSEHTDLNLEVEGMAVDEQVIVVSWGITHHKDWATHSLLFPINCKGYTFAFVDPDGVEVTVSDVSEPVFFCSDKLHSLAPYQRTTKPFIALVVDLYKKEEE